MSANNPGNQQRIAQKILRQLVQILKSSDGLTATLTQNAVQDWVLTVKEAGAWATTKFYALVKIQENELSTFPVQGYPGNKIRMCVEGTAASLGVACDAGYFSEVLSRLKDMGCELEVYVTAVTVQPIDDASSNSSSFTAATLKRHIRASVDTLGMSQ